MPIIHALVDPTTSPSPTTKGGEKLGAYIAAMVASGGVAEAAELNEGRNANDMTFTRAPGITSALLSPGLMEYLNEGGVKSLIVCGLSTSGAVLRTAMPATDAGFVVTVVEDACADPAQDVHDMVVGKVLPARAWVMTLEEWRRGYQGFWAC